MPHHFLFTLKKQAEMDLAEEELRYLGFQDLYILEDPDQGLRQIGGYLPEERIFPDAFKAFEMFEKKEDAIDWVKQWELFSYGYENGKSLVDLTAFGAKGFLNLFPGKGFGDLSHPTTTMCLELLCKYHNGFDAVIDIGCGSGVLSIAAKTLGIAEVFAIDIDEEALEHTRENAKLNAISDFYIGQRLPFNFEGEKNLLLLLNMTFKEQISAWEATYYQLNTPYHVIASGILHEQKEEYLELIRYWGWEVNAIKEEDSWLSFFCSGQAYLAS